jgi:hypothetical protein
MKAQDDNTDDALNRLSLKECRILLKGLKSDYEKGIYVRSKKDELIDRIKAIDTHIKKQCRAIESANNNSSIGNYAIAIKETGQDRLISRFIKLFNDLRNG